MLVLMVLIGLKRLVVDDLVEFFLDLIGEFILRNILLAFDNTVITFAGMNHVGVTEILVSLFVIMNVGQVGGCLVLLATHKSVSGGGDGDFGKFKLLFRLLLGVKCVSAGSCWSFGVIMFQHAGGEVVIKPFFLRD